MIPYALCIIDMQYSYKSARNWRLIHKCLDLIKKAKKDNQPIIVVRFMECGKVLPSILNATEGYKNYHYVTKMDTDGSQEISKVLKKYKDIKNIVMCGVQTDVCVKDTAKSLSKKYNIYLSQKGCYTFFADNNEVLKSLANLKNIALVA